MAQNTASAIRARMISQPMNVLLDNRARTRPNGRTSACASGTVKRDANIREPRRCASDFLADAAAVRDGFSAAVAGLWTRAAPPNSAVLLTRRTCVRGRSLHRRHFFGCHVVKHLDHFVHA